MVVDRFTLPVFVLFTRPPHVRVRAAVFSLPGELPVRAARVACVSICLLASQAAAGPPCEAPELNTPLTIDPVGQPAAYTDRIDNAKYFVWYEGGAWHLRTRAKSKAREFAGLIRVRGGRVTEIGSLAGLESNGRRGNRDRGFLRKGGREIAFLFRTAPGRKMLDGEDGFDFTVSDGATAVEFELNVRGFAHPERILIGPDGTCPPSARFALPAHPEAAGDEAG